MTPSDEVSQTVAPSETFVPDAEAKHRLSARLDQFSRAMAGGGERELFLAWRASRDALLAALEIAGTGEGGEPAQRFFNNGANPW